MKRFLLPVAGLLALASCDQVGSSKKVELNTFEDSLSYSIGYSYAEGMKNNSGEMKERLEIDVDLEVIKAGFLAGLDSTQEVLLTEEDSRELGMRFQAIAQQKQQEQNQKMAIEQAQHEAEQREKYKGNKEEGEKFLEENKAKSGVKVTESGLQYKVISNGSGAKPTASDRIKVHYTGKLLDGTVFDSSVERGQPVTFGVTEVIAGWTEGVQLMQEGAKYEFYIPYDLAYGEQGGGTIPPFSTLVFEVELLEIVPAQ